jgi:hypothetical protein
MDEEKAQNIFIIAFGIAVLWVGWGNALDLLFPGGVACGITDPEGLNLDRTLQLAYASQECPLVIYDYAWPAFLSLSAVGVTAVIVGWHRLKQLPQQH